MPLFYCYTPLPCPKTFLKFIATENAKKYALRNSHSLDNKNKLSEVFAVFCNGYGTKTRFDQIQPTGNTLR